MGFRDWFKDRGHKESGELSDAQVQAVARGALNAATNKAADAAQAALDKGVGDDAVVKAAVKAAFVELGGAFRFDTDERIISTLSISHPSSRQFVLSATRTALHTYNIGGSLPPARADALYAAFDRYGRMIEGTHL